MAIQKLKALNAIDNLVKLEMYEVAQQKLMQLFQEFPDDIDVTMSLATLLFEKGDYKGAKPLAESVLGRSPEDAEALNLLAGIHLKRKNLRKAEEFYKQTISAAPHQSVYYGNLGLVYLLKKAYNQAIDIAEEGLKHKPDDTNCLYVISSAYTSLDLSYKATPILKRILEIEPENPDALLMLGSSHHQKGELDEAQSIFKSVISIRGSQEYALAGIKRTDIDLHPISQRLNSDGKNRYIRAITIILAVLSGIASLSGNQPPIYLHEVFFLGLPQITLLGIVAIPFTTSWLYITDKSKRHLFDLSELFNAFLVIGCYFGAVIILLSLVLLWGLQLHYDRIWILAAIYGFLMSFFVGFRIVLGKEKRAIRRLSLLVILALMIGSFIAFDDRWVCFVGVIVMFFIDLKLLKWIGEE